MLNVLEEELDKILVSACLLGRPVRYDGRAKLLNDNLLLNWQKAGRVVSICPEVMAGMPTPRPPAEIQTDGRVIDSTGKDVSKDFKYGAEFVAKMAKKEGCRFALLTNGSPSCGSSFIYDGTFTGQKIQGVGLAVSALQDAGVKVFAEHQILELSKLIQD